MELVDFYSYTDQQRKIRSRMGPNCDEGLAVSESFVRPFVELDEDFNDLFVKTAKETYEAIWTVSDAVSFSFENMTSDNITYKLSYNTILEEGADGETSQTVAQEQKVILKR